MHTDPTTLIIYRAIAEESINVTQDINYARFSAAEQRRRTAEFRRREYNLSSRDTLDDSCYRHNKHRKAVVARQ